MKITVLTASPRPQGNTNQVTNVVVKELEALGHECKTYNLYEKEIHPCTACRKCQKNWETYECMFDDDVMEIYPEILESELLILSTPIYSWYCTAPMKAMLDRLVYGLNKYYGEEKGPSLWAGTKVALISTCGYKVEKGMDLWEEGMKRYIKHSQLEYLGYLAERHKGYHLEFWDEEKEKRAQEFARKLGEKA